MLKKLISTIFVLAGLVLADDTLFQSELSESKDTNRTVTDSLETGNYELSFTFYPSIIVGGGQNKTGIYWTDNTGKKYDPTSVIKSSVGINISKKIHKKLMAELNCDFYTWTTANGPAGAEPVDVYNGQHIRLGIGFEILKKKINKSIVKLSLKGGLNYNFLGLTKEYQDMLGFDPGTAKGLGYFAMTKFDIIRFHSLTYGAGIGYEQTNPAFKKALISFDGSAIIIPLTVGFIF